MKLTTENYDQAGFNHRRAIRNLLWIRKSKITSAEYDVSYRDMLQLHCEHCYWRLIDLMKRLYIRLRGAHSD